MERERLTLEYELHGNSVKIMWQLISSAEGLSHWLADEVTEKDGVLTVRWGDARGHNEVRTATILERKKYQYLRFRWDDEDDNSSFVELRVEHAELSDTYILVVTDFVEPDDKAMMTKIWDHDRQKLLRNTGV